MQKRILMVTDEAAAAIPATEEHVPQKTEAPRPQPSRAQRRASMRMMNNALLGDRNKLVEAIEQLQQSNRAMNMMLVWIAAQVGVKPKDHQNAADLLKARIDELVGLEKRMTLENCEADMRGYLQDLCNLTSVPTPKGERFTEALRERISALVHLEKTLKVQYGHEEERAS